MRRVVALLALACLFLLHDSASAQNARMQAKVQAKLALIAPQPIMPAQAVEAPSDEEVLQKARLKADGPALIEFFRKRTAVEADRTKMATLIRQLGDENFSVREKASSALVELGARAIPFLREAEKETPESDIEVVRRAEHCRVLIEGEAGAAVSAAAARVVARTKPPGAAPVLVAYLPFAEDENVTEELRNALVAVGVKDGKPDPSLVKALTDPQAVKRATAADVLCRASVKDQFPAVHRLLKDKDVLVRLRAAVGLTPHRDRQAVGTLISLLADLDEEKVWPAEELLVRMAGEDAPVVDLGTDAASRKKCSEAWAEWWKKHGDKVDLARVGRPPVMLGHTLLVQRDLVWKGGRFQTGRVQELDAAKKVLWKVEELMYPVDAQRVGKDRILVTEYQGRKVTERDLKGKVQWTWTSNQSWPLCAQRLANGHTFIALQNQLVEVDKAGKTVSSINRPNQDVIRAIKLRNGDIAMVSNRGMYHRLDPKGNERKSFNLGGGWMQQFSGFDVLPTGRIVVPQWQFNRVVEFNQEGKVVWQANVQWPTYVQRLPNGHTLVASQNANLVLVLDRKGKVVWQHNSDGQVLMARRR
jgi:HEAT repeat protein